MFKGPRWLVSLEVASIIAWISLVLWFMLGSPQEQLQPLTLEALKGVGAEERWNGIFFHDQHVGYSVSRTSNTENELNLFEQRSMMRIATFGRLQTIVTAGAALTDSEGALQRFDFMLTSEDTKLSVRGTVKNQQIVMELRQNDGEIQALNFPIERPPHVALSLEGKIRQTELSLGKSFTVPYFDPTTMSDGEMTLRVVDSEILENEEEAWWIQTEFNGVEARSLVTTRGDILRQEGSLGLSMVRMTAEAAQNITADNEQVDLISLSAVTVTGKIKRPRKLIGLDVEVQGISKDLLRNEPPLQSLSTTGESAALSINIPTLETFSGGPLKQHSSDSDFVGAEALKTALESTITIAANHLEIRSKSQDLLGSVNNRLEAAQKLNQFVFDYMEKVPVIGVPSGLQSLRSARGDCNEHTALFVSLARAAEIPTRIAAGLVFSDRAGPIGQFYYHAWPEVLLERSPATDTEAAKLEWVAFDPTFGQAPADATHIKLAEGDLDQQVEIMAFLGQVSLNVLSTKHPDSSPTNKEAP